MFLYMSEFPMSNISSETNSQADRRLMENAIEYIYVNPQGIWQIYEYADVVSYGVQ